MVATPHALATQAGLAMLERGGSAADAAVAANAVLAVVYPHMAGLGGDLFCLVWDAHRGALSGLNASGRAAARATIEHFTGAGHQTIPTRGPLAAATVPGAVDGWACLLAQHGRLGLAEALAPAMGHAERGVPVSRSLAAWSARARDVLARYPTTAAIYLPGGRPFREGEVLAQPELGRSLRRVAEHGADVFYRGELAERIGQFLADNGGLLNADDFARHRSDWVEPLMGHYRKITVAQLPPNTQGYAALQLLGIAEGFDLAAMGDGSVEYVHTLAEAARLAFEDRDRYLGDPEFVDVPIERILSDERVVELRRRLRDPPFDPPRKQGGGGGPVPLPAGGPQGGRPGGDTVYICAVDADGNAVSLIQSIYFDFGSALIAGDTGILLQNRGSFFSLDPDHPNRLEPGKRPFHTLIPAMALADGRPMLLYGTMGGEGQPQTQAAMLTRIVDFGYDVQQAIDAPRWLYGRTWGEASVLLSIETRFPIGTIDGLARRGHEVQPVGPWSDSMGHAQAIRIHPSGVLEGGADPRSDGSAAGI